VSLPQLFETLDYGPAPESPAPGNEWIGAFEGKFGLFIGGKWQAGTAHFDSVNPATGETLAQISQASADEVDAAIRAARTALPAWQALPASDRAKYLYALARGLQKHSRQFAVLESLDNGKPIRETRDLDIPLAIRHFYHHAGWAVAWESEYPNHAPVGVCAQIIPWNFPLLMLAWKIAPALACGNVVVLKPAEFTSLTALRFAQLCEEIGLPSGVVNIITGDGQTGAAMVNHPDVDKVAFTGSTEVGRILRKATAGTGKKLSLELGGKSPFIVFDDADLDSAIEGIVDAIWFNQGQVCCAGSRLLVAESIEKPFLNKLRQRMETLRVGPPLDKAIDMGAIIDPVQLERIDSLVKQGVAEGAELYQSPSPLPERGCFYPPTLLANVGPANTVAQVEIFGPVLVAMPFRTHAEAVDLANNTAYGLASSLWTENLSLAHDIARQIKAGTVWINCTNQFDGAVGFGGYRESGFGREGGVEGLAEYLKPTRAEFPAFPAGSTAKSDAIDRTHKLFVGGKQVRPDGGLSETVNGITVSRSNRKDVRNAVEAACSAQPGWAKATAFNRSQVLYFLAENLSAAKASFVPVVSEAEFDFTVNAIFELAAWADKFEGRIHQAPMRGIVYSSPEAWGTVGIVAGEAQPLAGLLVPIAAALAMGNTVVALPSEKNPIPAVELIHVVEQSDLPAGTVNVLTMNVSETAPVLAEHDGIEALWCFDSARIADGETRSVGNLKAVWGEDIDVRAVSMREWMRRACQMKNIWVPAGD
jgi:aldehyde dehydrogenase (NAD+)